MRTIIEGEGFANAKYSVHPDPEILDELLDPLMWTLARTPLVGEPVDDFGMVYCLVTRRWGPHGLAPLVIYYLFDENFVTLLSIKKVSDIP